MSRYSKIWRVDWKARLAVAATCVLSFATSPPAAAEDGERSAVTLKDQSWKRLFGPGMDTLTFPGSNCIYSSINPVGRTVSGLTGSLTLTRSAGEVTAQASASDGFNHYSVGALAFSAARGRFELRTDAEQGHVEFMFHNQNHAPFSQVFVRYDGAPWFYAMSQDGNLLQCHVTGRNLLWQASTQPLPPGLGAVEGSRGLPNRSAVRSRLFRDGGASDRSIKEPLYKRIEGVGHVRSW